MPTLVQLGAGAIGRGFIAPTFAAAGWLVVFVDLDAALVGELARRGAYRLTLVDPAGERVQEVRGVSAIDGRDRAAVGAALAACDLAATAVGLGALPHLGPAIADGLARRLAAGGAPLDVLLCENGAEAAPRLRQAVLAALPAELRGRGDAALGTVRTSIGRMIPPAQDGGSDLRAEPYDHLPVERAAFRGTPPAVPGIEPADDWLLVQRQKLNLHNLTHATLAYHGALAGRATIPDCMAEPALAAEAAAVGDEVCRALGRLHGAAAEAASRAILADLQRRYRNRALADPVARVGRDPLRKLAPDDRLLGSLRLCREAGVKAPAIHRAIAAALRFVPAAADPGAAEWSALQRRGAAAVLAAAGLPAGDALLPGLLAAERDLGHRLGGVARIRAADLTLLDGEAVRLEIADFGLGRYAEFGLAIHVYVNTERCCAKELAMEPGQICPEHRHPMVDGQPGKEETFRVRRGEVHLFVDGEGDREAALRLVPADKRGAFTAFRHIHLRPGEQYTLAPDTRHWFVAGPEGAVVSEFSTRSRDEADIFTDPAIVRVPEAAA